MGKTPEMNRKRTLLHEQHYLLWEQHKRDSEEDVLLREMR